MFANLDWQSILYYVIAIVGVGLVIWGALWYARKNSDASNQLTFVKMIMETLSYLMSFMTFPNVEIVKKVIKYVIQAINMAIQVAKESYTDITEYKEFIFNKAKEICAEEGITVDETIEAAIRQAIDFILMNFTKKDLTIASAPNWKSLL
jgi:hypothetical protein